MIQSPNNDRAARKRSIVTGVLMLIFGIPLTAFLVKAHTILTEPMNAENQYNGFLLPFFLLPGGVGIIMIGLGIYLLLKHSRKIDKQSEQSDLTRRKAIIEELWANGILIVILMVIVAVAACHIINLSLEAGLGIIFYDFIIGYVPEIAFVASAVVLIYKMKAFLRLRVQLNKPD